MTQEFKHVFYSHAAEKRRSALAIALACLRDVCIRRSRLAASFCDAACRMFLLIL